MKRHKVGENMKPEQFYCQGRNEHGKLITTQIDKVNPKKTCERQCIRINAYGETVVCGELKLAYVYATDFIE